MRILSIDQGNELSAFCVLKYNASGEIEFLEKGKIPNAELRDKIISNELLFEKMVIEGIECFGMPVGKTVFETCYWAGRYMEIASYLNIPYYIVTRREEKLHLCGNMRVRDTNIRQALIQRFAKFDFKNGKGTKNNRDVFYGVKADIWSAIAIGVTFLETKLK